MVFCEPSVLLRYKQSEHLGNMLRVLQIKVGHIAFEI